MKERRGYELPHPSFGGWDKRGISIKIPIYLVDYVTIGWRANGQEYEAEVHPDRVLDFMENQEKILGKLDDWWYD